MQRFSHDLVYDAPLRAVAAMLRDRSFREDVCVRQHVVRHSVRVEEAGGRTLVTVEQVQRPKGLPSVAQKMVGDELTIVQAESWSGEHEADVVITIPGKPGEITGSVRLTEADGRTTERVELQISVAIPLIGGKVEGVVAELLHAALRAEHEVGTGYLSR